MTENVVKLKPDKRRIDLRGSNRLKDLLETRVEQAAIIAEAMKLKKEADAEIYELLGDAEYALADGYSVSITSFERREFVMPACTIRRMMIRKRKEKR